MRRRFLINSQNVNYMAIEALEDGLTATISGTLDSYSKIEYSIDGVDWINMEIDVATSPINYGEKLLFKGNYLGSATRTITFSISKKCNLKGDIKTLWYGDNAGRYKTALYAGYLFKDCTTIQHVDKYFLSPVELTKSCYYGLFAGCTSLTTATELPAKTLEIYCYSYMFYGCTALTTAPILRATKLASSCYSSMFYGCTGLTTAPALPATTLTNDCYSHMFYGCTKLNYIKMMATDISASNCLINWVKNVASTGTFVKNPAMTSLPTGTSGIPSGWTVVNDGEESGGDTPEFTLYLYTEKKQNYSVYHIEPCKETLALVDYFWENAVEGPAEWDLRLSAGSLYIDGWELDYLTVFKNDPDRADFEVYKNYDGISMPRGQLYVTGEKKGLLEIYDEY